MRVLVYTILLFAVILINVKVYINIKKEIDDTISFSSEIDKTLGQLNRLLKYFSYLALLVQIYLSIIVVSFVCELLFSLFKL